MAARKTSAPVGAAGAIKHIQISNFLGIDFFDVDVPPGGAVLAGRNGSGKSSVLKAVRAALEAEGVSTEAIHVGAAKSEILIDLEDFTVRRAITEKGASLKVTRPDGAIMPSPQTFLRTLLGVSPLDPLAFWKAKDRRAMLLDALPVEVTPVMLRAWAGAAVCDDQIAAAVGCAPGAFSTATEDDALPGHGLDLVARLRASIYADRTEANRVAKTREAETAAEKAAHAVILAELGAEVVPTVEEAQAGVEAVRTEEAGLAARRRAAVDGARARTRTEGQIAKLREQAAAKLVGAPIEPTAAELEEAQERAEAEERAAATLADVVTDLRKRLAEAEQAATVAALTHADAMKAVEALQARGVALRVVLADAAALYAQADDLAAALGTAPAEPTQDEEAALADQRAEAERRLGRARRGLDANVAVGRVLKAGEAHEAARARAAALDAAVKALDDAPRELLAATPGLAGITIEGDVIRLDGVPLDTLNTAAQIAFAVRVAKALSGRCKILLIDGLEAVDPDQLPGFLAEATAGGFQLLAARVATGDRRVEPIGTPAQAELPLGEGAAS